MYIDFSNFSAKERPILVLKNAHEDVLGVLGTAFGIRISATFNELSTMSFSLPAETDGEGAPFYDKVEAMRIVQLVGIGQFIINKVSESNDGVKRIKTCDCYSLEYELSRKKITIPKGTYRFYSASSSDETLMSMVMAELPSWSVGTVPDSLVNKYRTYEVANTTIYDFLKNTVQQSYNCIFTFDTDNRTINLIDAQNMPVARQVFISNDNLAKEIKVDENIDNIVTRLDVTGAEDVNIRDVNPTGTNKIIDLSYYMNSDNFDAETINKYNAWAELVESYRDTYYMLTLQYSAAVALKTSQNAELVELQGELTALENVRGTIIQGIAEGTHTQSDLNAKNTEITQKNTQIAQKRSQITQTEASIADYQQSLRNIVTTCSISNNNNFTDAQRMALDKYYKDGEIQDSSFTMSNTASYTGNSSGVSITSKSVSISGADIKKTVIQETGRTVYDIKGGTLSIAGLVSAYIISAVLDVSSGSPATITFTSYLSYGTLASSSQIFPSGCVTVSGTGTNITSNCVTDPEAPTISIGSSASFSATGYYYFTSDTSEYQKRYVAYELYEYGRDMLTKLAQPTYTFSVTSANFFTAEGFETFKNDLRLGDTVYVQLKEGQVISPICIGVEFSYDDLNSLSLKFSDSFVSSDSVFRLTDLLKDSVSTSKTVEASKYAYGEFIDKNANNEILEYMKSALDVSKNSILSSTGQAITWDDAGIRLRKITSTNPVTYSNEQIWMNNNSIVMTDDNWATATMAIGKFKDPNNTTGGNNGTYWGINAQRVFGTLIAGSNLWIQCPNQQGTMLFKVDGNGAYIYNGQIDMVSGNREVVINPTVGLVMGKNPVLSNGAVNTNNAYLYADSNGNLHLKGDITATSGTFTGTVYADSGSFAGDITANTLTLTTSSQNTIKQLISADYIRAQTAGLYTYTGSGLPSTGSSYKNGDTYYCTGNHSVYRYNGTAWTRITPKTFNQSSYPTTSQSAHTDGFIEGDRWRCTGTVTQSNTTYYNGNIYQYNGSAWVGISGEIKNSSVTITPENVNITTSTFDVTIAQASTAETELQVDSSGVTAKSLEITGGKFALGSSMYEDGAIVEHYNGSTVIYCGGSSSQAVNQFNDACAALCDKHLKEDVVIKVPWTSLVVKPILRNVTGAKVIISPYSLMDRAASDWESVNSATMTHTTPGATFKVNANSAGTWRYMRLRLGTVSSLGLLGKRLYLGATATQSGNGSRGRIAVVLYRKGPSGNEVYSTIKTLATSAAGTAAAQEISGYIDIPDRTESYYGMEDAEVAVCLYASIDTACDASAYVTYTNCCVTIGGSYSANNFPGVWYCGGAILDNCSSQIIFTNALFRNYLSAMNSNFILNQCTLMAGFLANDIDGSDGKINHPPSIQQYGGNSSLRNCDGGGSSDLNVFAQVRGGGLMTIEGKKKPYGQGIGEVHYVDYIADPGGSVAPDPPSTLTGQKTLSVTTSDTYWDSWANSDDDPRQGTMSSHSNMKGWAYFNITGLPTGYSITGATLKFTRLSGYGKDGAVNIRVYKSTTYSNSGSAPNTSGDPITQNSYISPGQTKTLDVTSLIGASDTKFAVTFSLPSESVLSGKTYSSNFARFKGSSFKLTLNYTYPA